MRIVMLTPFFYPHIGGVEKHVQKVAECLVQKGHEITIITSKHTSSLPDFERIGKLPIYRISRSPIPKTSRLKIWSSLRRSQALRESNIVHTHDYPAFIYWHRPFRTLWPGKPTYVTFHGFEGYPLDKRVIRLRKLTEKMADGSICIGAYIQKWYGTKCPMVNYGGVDVLRRNLTQKTTMATFVGRLEKDTGIMAYLETLAILKIKHNFNLPLVICGDGSLRNVVEKYARDNQLDVTLKGFIDDPTVWLAKSKYAFVSGYLSILEAMACKALVLNLYENPLKKDYLESFPHWQDLMVTKDSAEQLAKGLHNYEGNPQQVDKKIELACDYASQQTWEKVADLYLKLYERCV